MEADMVILLVALMILAVFAALEGIALKNLMREYRKLELERGLLEDIISERFIEYEKTINKRKFPYGNGTDESILR